MAESIINAGPQADFDRTIQGIARTGDQPLRIEGESGFFERFKDNVRRIMGALDLPAREIEEAIDAARGGGTLSGPALRFVTGAAMMVESNRVTAEAAARLGLPPEALRGGDTATRPESHDPERQRQAQVRAAERRLEALWGSETLERFKSLSRDATEEEILDTAQRIEEEEARREGRQPRSRQETREMLNRNRRIMEENGINVAGLHPSQRIAYSRMIEENPSFARDPGFISAANAAANGNPAQMEAYVANNPRVRENLRDAVTLSSEIAAQDNKIERLHVNRPEGTVFQSSAQPAPAPVPTNPGNQGNIPTSPEPSQVVEGESPRTEVTAPPSQGRGRGEASAAQVQLNAGNQADDHLTVSDQQEQPRGRGQASAAHTQLNAGNQSNTPSPTDSVAVAEEPTVMAQSVADMYRRSGGRT
ncbi:MAG: hypothetical protein FWF01_04170 [Alphaproteobacteria bacterium]|nr:hypothetical protein [Alphaproteobacteria bacterium]